MDRIKKLLSKIDKGDRILIQSVILRILRRDFEGLERKKLKGSRFTFRVRVGSYRVIFYDDGDQIYLQYVRRRNEKTYKNV